MRRLLLMVLCVVAASCVAEEWDDLSVVQVNTEKPHATMMTYPTVSLAMKDLREESPWFKSLRGDWKFNWVKNPASRPVDFYKNDFDDSAWKTIPVPSNWSKFGYGTPIYTNIRLPFPKRPPKAPRDYNPVGSYRTTFTLPPDWDGRRTLIHFAGVNSAFYLWINGKQVGYSSGSRTPAEFDITDYLVPGRNMLAAEVYRWHEGSYMEDQDFWRIAGIFRDVYLWSRGQVSIRDFEVNTDLDDAYKNATLDVSVDLQGKAEGHTVDMQLLDASGKEVLSQTMSQSESHVSLPVASPDLWNTESPYLYRMLLTLKKGGKVIEVIPWRVGFRKVEIKGPQFIVNGVPVKMKGVNRHETCPENWHYITRESALKDVELMKKFNVNAVRTCHYPDDPLFYKLCDEYGIFVMDETNIECHDNRNLSGKPEWVKLQMNRCERMAERDKNHASIIMWSLGNESGGGIGPETMYKWLRENHPDRPVHCEYNNKTADIESRMYANAWWGGKANRPHVLCEYAHAMGNSNGNLKEYWETIYKYESHMGAFVWDWADQGLRQPVPDAFKKNIGKGPVKDTFFAYGGWWEDKENRHTDKNFCMNGLVSSDRIPHPGLYALKWVHRNVHVTPVDLAAGTFKVRNWFDYSTISDRVYGEWAVYANGVKLRDGKLPELDVKPHEEKEFSIGPLLFKRVPGVEYLLGMSFKAKKGYSPLVPEGHELAWEQFVIGEVLPLPVVAPKGRVKTEVEGDVVRFSGKDFVLVFDKQVGLQTYTVKGQKLLDSGFAPDFWRSLTDNDRPARGRYTDERKWKHAGPEHKIANAVVQPLDGGAARIVFHVKFPEVTGPCTIAYTAYPDGQVEVGMAYTPGKGQNIRGPLRQGLIARLAGELNQVTWYGRGPQPTYCDRKLEPVGVYKSTVDDLWIDYSKPQENGNRENTRWVALTDAQGKGLLFAGDPEFNFSARFYDKAEMWKSKYSFQMERSDSIFLNIDHAQCGVGGDNSWGATPHGKYQLKNTAFSHTFRMVPITRTKDISKALASRPPSHAYDE